MKAIHLTFPLSLSDEEIDLLYIKFKEEFPRELANWEEIERNYDKLGADPLRKIQLHVIRFLKNNTIVDSLTAISMAWVEMRKKVIERLDAH